jgi:hypothetical protein
VFDVIYESDRDDDDRDDDDDFIAIEYGHDDLEDADLGFLGRAEDDRCE